MSLNDLIRLRSLKSRLIVWVFMPIALIVAIDLVGTYHSTEQMATKIQQLIKTELKRESRVEGLPTADWVLIDAGDVVVHLFRPEVRSFYNLERMGGFGDAGVAAVGQA